MKKSKSVYDRASVVIKNNAPLLFVMPKLGVGRILNSPAGLLVQKFKDCRVTVMVTVAVTV